MTLSHTWRCDCAGGHFVHIEQFHDDPLFVVDAYQPHSGLRERLTAAWKELRADRHVYVEVVLRGDVAAEIAAVLTNLDRPDDTH